MFIFMGNVHKKIENQSIGHPVIEDHKKKSDIKLENSSFQTILNYRRADAFICGKLYYSFATTKEREESERYF